MSNENRVCWRTPDAMYYLIIEKLQIKQLEKLCSDARDEETGGILIGHYTDDFSTAIVTEVTPPPADSRKGPSWFIRGISGLRQLLRKRWIAYKRRYYIGEWHYHPASIVEPSSNDMRQMTRIANSKDYECKNPIMLILGQKVTAGDRSMRAFVFSSNNNAKEMFRINTEPIISNSHISQMRLENPT
ncbi:MAG: Mov34/MPN/PAD-1 family protein [Candidatus Pacebacteria bacterium]|nr:Mov34/MPN/PAD-1 family protein [Candidatus Paceibacterota bacterium]MDD5222471.1 Mov34/MPN/PAD-1 family protein [bacterium]